MRVPLWRVLPPATSSSLPRPRTWPAADAAANLIDGHCPGDKAVRLVDESYRAAKAYNRIRSEDNSLRSSIPSSILVGRVHVAPGIVPSQFVS